eukprot:4566479-Prymnesium_polylepis.1
MPAGPCSAMAHALRGCLPKRPDDDGGAIADHTGDTIDVPGRSASSRSAAAAAASCASTARALRQHLEDELAHERQTMRAALLGCALCACAWASEPPLSSSCIVLAMVLIAAHVAADTEKPAPAAQAAGVDDRPLRRALLRHRRVSIDLDATQFPAALQAIEDELSPGSPAKKRDQWQCAVKQTSTVLSTVEHWASTARRASLGGDAARIERELTKRPNKNRPSHFA